MWLLFTLACADSTPAWAVQHASVVPTAQGLTGTQTWEFFSASWTPDKGDDGYICARAQTLTGAVTSLADCPGCRAAYTLTVEELESDCEGGEATDAAFAGPDVYSIGDVADDLADDDPHPDRSFGWAVAFGDGELVDVGYAWPESLDTEGDAGAPGWTTDRPYTLWPAVAWEL